MQPANLKLHPPFRADHVGSLLRPSAVVRARKQLAAGEITPAELRRIEDEQIAKLVTKQEEVGLRSITDGECRRTSFYLDFCTQLDGVTSETQYHMHWNKGDVKIPSCNVTSKIGHSKDIQTRDFSFLKEHVKAPCCGKVCLPSPAILHFHFGGNNKVYPNEDEFFDDLAKAYHAEIDALYKAGCRYIQLDDTNLSSLCDPRRRETMLSQGCDVDSLPEKYARLINKSIEGRPDDLVISIHLCKGNYRSQWFAEGGYEYVAKTLFNSLNVDAYFLEWDDERSGDFQPLRHVPPGKLVVLGIVTSKVGQLEKKEALVARIHEAAKYCPLEQLAISPQCGFASTEEGNDILEEDQWAKLRLCVEVAKEVWGEI